MNKAFELILERLEVFIEKSHYEAIEGSHNAGIRNNEYHKVKKIVQEVAEEYEDGWIPCSERLPEDGVPVLLQDSEGYYSLGVSESKRNIKGFRDGDWWGSANNYKAWQPLPELYKEKE